MLTPADHEMVAAAIRAAETGTDGEIGVVVAPESDAYADVVLHWALLAALLPLALFASVPKLIEGATHLLHRPWGDEAAPLRLAALVALLATALAFLLALSIVRLPGVKARLTPHATKARRVRRRAITLFQVGTERRTASRTGVLIYLSLAEHRAEIVADASIQSRIGGEEWGEAMAALIDGLRGGRPGAGIAAAVEKVGAVLAQHFPHTGTDPNELPDRLIEL